MADERDLLAGLAALPPGDLPDPLAGLLPERPAWHAEAACRGRGPSVFYAGSVDAAKAVCEGCPVVVECAEAGQDEPDGVWGGLSPRERAKARKARESAA